MPSTAFESSINWSSRSIAARPTASPAGAVILELSSTLHNTTGLIRDISQSRRVLELRCLWNFILSLTVVSDIASDLRQRHEECGAKGSRINNVQIHDDSRTSPSSSSDNRARFCSRSAASSRSGSGLFRFTPGDIKPLLAPFVLPS